MSHQHPEPDLLYRRPVIGLIDHTLPKVQGYPLSRGHYTPDMPSRIILTVLLSVLGTLLVAAVLTVLSAVQG